MSNVDRWLERETPRVRKALESASRYFDANDNLTVNTLEAVYGRESSFGTMLGERGSSGAAGHFQFEPKTARRYGLSISKQNDQRFDIDRARRRPNCRRSASCREGGEESAIMAGRRKASFERDTAIRRTRSFI